VVKVELVAESGATVKFPFGVRNVIELLINALTFSPVTLYVPPQISSAYKILVVVVGNLKTALDEFCLQSAVVPSEYEPSIEFGLVLENVPIA